MKKSRTVKTFISPVSLAGMISLLLLILIFPDYAAAGVVSRTTTFTYDARGQFATSTTNALGQTETYTHDARFGNKLSQTGPNGLTTTWSYDSFGRKTGETRADGTSTTVTRQWCDGFNGNTGNTQCPTGGVLALTTQVDGTTPKTAISDAYGRVLRTATIGRDGQFIYSDTQYNARGEISRKSLPYFAGDTAQWSTFYYDALSRVYREVTADGSQNNTGFNGLSTSIINALGQINDRTKDVLGHVVYTYDADTNETYYRYDPFGNLVETQDNDGNIIHNTYDIRGRKIAMDDPDMGHWTYQYNAFGELVSQTDAKGQTTTMSYDPLGRMVSRTEPEGTSTWTYDTATNGIGKVAQVTGAAGDIKTFQYDNLGRPSSVTTQIDGQSYTVATAYDADSRVSSITYPHSTEYPQGLIVGYHYTATSNGDASDGYLTTVTNNNDGTTYWQATAQDAAGNLTDIALGNGLTTHYNYQATTGRLVGIQTGSTAGGHDIQNLGYTYDAIGNLTQRSDYNQYLDLTPLHEDFSYDNLNRLVSSQVYNQAQKTYSYDALGNITSKSGVGNYTYGQNAGPHAVTQTTNGRVTTSYSYDANGNMVQDGSRSISYASYNKPTNIADSATGTSISFVYGAGHNRIKRTDNATGKTRYYIGDLFEKEVKADLMTYTHYIKAAGNTVAIVTSKSDGSHDTRYLHKDHLGSITAITDENGLVVEQQSYDAFGKRRNSDWTDIAGPTPVSPVTDRGYTGHEHIDEVGLIHMNGRVYDPTLGRFTSADPNIQQPYNSQSLNRYSYVLNNPLSYTDPSGYFFGHLFKAIKHIVSGAVHAVSSVTKTIWRLENSVLRKLAKIPALNAVVQVGVYAYGGPQALALYNARQTYAMTGDLRAAFRSGGVAYANAKLFGYRGSFVGFKQTKFML